MKIRKGIKNKNKKAKAVNKSTNVKKYKHKNTKNEIQEYKNEEKIDIEEYKQAEYSYKISQWLQIL